MNRVFLNMRRPGLDDLTAPHRPVPTPGSSGDGANAGSLAGSPAGTGLPNAVPGHIPGTGPGAPVSPAAPVSPLEGPGAPADEVYSSVSAEQRTNRQTVDGLSYYHATDVGLAQIEESLRRQLEVATQALALPRSTLQAMAALDQEFQANITKIDAVAESTSFRGIQPLLARSLNPAPSLREVFGPSGSTQTLPAGTVSLATVPTGATRVRLQSFDWGLDKDLQVFTTAGRHVSGTPLRAESWVAAGVTTATVDKTVVTPANGFAPSASYDGTNLVSEGTADVEGTHVVYSGNRHAQGEFREEVMIDKVTTPLVFINSGSGSATVTASWEIMPELALPPPRSTDGPASSPTGASSGGAPLGAPAPWDASASGLNLSGTNLQSPEAAQVSLARVKAALAQVTEARGALAKYADSLMPDPTPGITGTVTALATNANPEDFEKMLRLAEATKQTITKGGPPSLLAQAARLTRQLAKSLLPF